jgi:predicted GIY-YIG superfamily endonuclease
MQKIYVLQCENGKYYIGKTSNVDRRFAEHLSGEYGSEWTSYYTPRQVIEVENMISDFDEMKKTLEYMKRFGIDHVRGAQWSNINLTSEQRTTIMKAMNTDGCFHCGQIGHFSNNCTHRNQSFQTQQRIQCFTCGNYGHFANECNYGRNMVMQCERCGRDSHFKDDCYAKISIDGTILDCARCGRDSHSADECYATLDIHRRRLY